MKFGDNMGIFKRSNKHKAFDTTSIDNAIEEVLRYREDIKKLYDTYIQLENEIWEGTEGANGKYSKVLTLEKAVTLSEKLAEETGNDSYSDLDLLGEFFTNVSQKHLTFALDDPDGLYALFSYNPKLVFDDTEEGERLKEWSDLVKQYAGVDEDGEALPWYFARSIPSWFAGDIVSEGTLVELLDWCIHNMERYEVMSQEKTIDPYDILGNRDFSPLRHVTDEVDLARNEKAMRSAVLISKNTKMILEDLVEANHRIMEFYQRQYDLEDRADQLYLDFLKDKNLL